MSESKTITCGDELFVVTDNTTFRFQTDPGLFALKMSVPADRFQSVKLSRMAGLDIIDENTTIIKSGRYLAVAGSVPAPDIINSFIGSGKAMDFIPHGYIFKLEKGTALEIKSSVNADKTVCVIVVTAGTDIAG